MLLAQLTVLAAAAAPPAAAAAPAAPALGGADYAADVEAWRRQREARLRAPDGWLALVGLTWLHPGANRFGGAPDDEVRLPASVPAHAGTLHVVARPGGGAAAPMVTIELAPGAAATLNGRPWPAGGGGGGGGGGGAAAGKPVALAVDSDGSATPPDIVGFGSVTLQVIERNGRLGARIKDPESPTRQRFGGLAWFPVAAELRVVARLSPHAGGPAEIVVPDASGGRQRLRSPGRLTFTLAGRSLALDPVIDGPDDADLLVVFRDATSGRDSYGAGRFVRAKRSADGSYVVDFNRAYSPPCAFTPYATCPLPPPQNHLPLAIAAGEKIPPGSGHPAGTR